MDARDGRADIAPALARETWSEISRSNELHSRAQGPGAGDHSLSVNPEQLERCSMHPGTFLSAAVRVSRGADCCSEPSGDSWPGGGMNGPGPSWTGSQGSSYIQRRSAVDSPAEQTLRARWRTPGRTSSVPPSAVRGSRAAAASLLMIVSSRTHVYQETAWESPHLSV